MKKFYQRLVVFVCIFTFCAYSFSPKKTQAFVPLVIGGVYVSYEVLLATATLCTAMGIVIVNRDQLVAMAEKFNAIPDFANHVIGHTAVQIEEYWFQYLVDRVSIDGSSLSYNYAPTEFKSTGLKSPYDYLNAYKSAYDLSNHDLNASGVSSNINSFGSSFNSTFNASMQDFISSVQNCGLPYIIIKAHWHNPYSAGAEFYGYSAYISLDASPLLPSTSVNGNIPIFSTGRVVNVHASWIQGKTGNLYSAFTGACGNKFSLPGSIDTYFFNMNQSLSQFADTVNYHLDGNIYTTDYTSNVWDYGNCALPDSYPSDHVGDYGQVTSPAVPSDQAKHWGDVFGADQSGTIDMGKALDDLKTKGIDTSKAATVDGVNAMDITYPLDSVQDIPDVSVDDVSQDSSIPYVPPFDVPDSSSSAQLDFTPLMIVTRKFPFSLPWDLSAAISSLSSDEQAPVFTVPAIPVGLHGETYFEIPSFGFDINSLPNINILVSLCKIFQILAFCVFLIVKTRDIIRS